MILIVLNIIFCISLLGFAYVNLNDPDAWLWVPIYGYAALCCGIAAWGIRHPLPLLLGIGFYAIYALRLFFARDGVRDWFFKYRRPSLVESMQASKPYIEKTREFFGLLIAMGCLSINYLFL